MLAGVGMKALGVVLAPVWKRNILSFQHCLYA